MRGLRRIWAYGQEVSDTDREFTALAREGSRAYCFPAEENSGAL